jgi:selenocysteine-specific elongation factor
MKDEEAEAKAQIEQALGNAGLNAPLLKELLANLKIDKARAQKILYLLFREKVLIRVDDDYVFHKSAIDDLHRRLSEYKTRSTRISIPQFKELIGVTRKHAMALLIYLDREHTTMRSGTERILL